jgi:DNA polymerase III alpha subunit
MKWGHSSFPSKRGQASEVPYAELHCVSNFSFLRGASHAEELVAQARELGYTALAITDECSLAGVVRAHTAVKKLGGIKLLIGAEFRLGCGLRLVVIARNRAGYARLSRLITRGRRRAEKASIRSIARTSRNSSVMRPSRNRVRPSPRAR